MAAKLIHTRALPPSRYSVEESEPGESGYLTVTDHIGSLSHSIQTSSLAEMKSMLTWTDSEWTVWLNRAFVLGEGVEVTW